MDVSVSHQVAADACCCHGDPIRRAGRESATAIPHSGQLEAGSWPSTGYPHPSQSIAARGSDSGDNASRTMDDFRRITPDDPLHEQERCLRRDVLLAPIGLTLEAFDRLAPDLESRAEHHVCVMDHPRGPRVIACALLVVGDPEPFAATMTQVAVDPQRQGEGIGRRLVTMLESRAFGELGLTSLCCTAHLPAVGFYEALGWRVAGEVVEILGIPHRHMTLTGEPGGTAGA